MLCFNRRRHPTQANSHDLFASFLTLLETGVGSGMLTTLLEAAPANFLEHCLRNWLPSELARLEPKQGPAMMARLWNLAEGLGREPGWVQAYILSRAGDFQPGTPPEEFLISVLRPLFVPAPTPTWQGPFRVTLLSMRAADDEFLPGDQYLAAPSVLVVADRKRQVRLGVHLRIHGRSEILGTFGQTSPPIPQHGPECRGYLEARGELLYRRRTLSRCPFLHEPFRWTITTSGFIVASSRDSQKLWIVEAFA